MGAIPTKWSSLGLSSCLQALSPEMLAQQMEALIVRVEALELRLANVDQVIGGLEGAALTTARALQESTRL